VTRIPVVIGEVKLKRQSNLAKVIQAFGGLRLLLGFG
jgi:hypothetical protein